MKKVLWFTGLSGSGKSTLSNALRTKLKAFHLKVVLIDGDHLRKKPHKHLSFSREDIKKNNLLAARLATEKLVKNDYVLVSIIAPFQKDRIKVRSMIGESYKEIFISCPIDVCIKRDAKGLYKKALTGEIRNFIGLSKSNPYEPPKHPDLTIETDKLSLAESLDKLIKYLNEKD